MSEREEAITQLRGAVSDALDEFGRIDLPPAAQEAFHSLAAAEQNIDEVCKDHVHPGGEIEDG